MTIPTEMSLTGFIATTPQLTFAPSGVARFYARIGVNNFRRENNGALTPLDPSYHDLVMFGRKAERAYDIFRTGDRFVAAGYIHEFTREHEGRTKRREQFVAKQMGHDANRVRYDVHRRAPEPAPDVEAPAASATAPVLHSL